LSHTHRLLFALLLLFGEISTVSAQSTGALPEMGDSSATILSAEDELRIGKEMLRQLKERGAVIDDPIINEYIQRLGSQLAAGADAPSVHFTFFVVNASSINAFALPGGFIGVHAGLILASEAENELAAVIAHEIAHVTQHHIARSVEQANKMNLPMTAAVIAAILLGGSDPQVANAALAATIGGSQQMQLNFTRANESEADRVGMQLLAASDFDPHGMAEFFSRLEDESRYYGNGVPEFLRTHPVTTARIAEAADRARQYPSMMMKGDSHYYGLVKARLRLRLAESTDALLQQLDAPKSASQQSSEDDTYLRALIYEKQGKIDAARTEFNTLLQRYPDRIAFIYGLAQLESGQGRFAHAIALYRHGLELYPGNELLTLALADTLQKKHDLSPARELIQQQLVRNPHSNEAYRLLAQVEAASGNQAASHLAQAEYYYLTGEPRSALDQLTTAKRIGSLDLYHASRIDARIKQIKDELAREERLSEH
jgi:predicted Zn-dependent protease